ncbi:MAG: DNA methylase N-4 [Methylobacterium sp.]|nr:MAG: DNA methylase N-4 [Methylobacterium sp.]
MSLKNAPAIEMRAVSQLRPHPNNARRHSKRQIRQIAESIRRFGFTNPVLVSDDGGIIAGHGRVEAARLLAMAEVPTLALSHLTESDRRAYILADNKLALNAGWDADILAIELQGLIDLDFDVEVTGFSLAEVDFVLDASREKKDEPKGGEPADRVPPLPETAVTRRGDLWALGKHKLICGDAREASDYTTLLGSERVDLVFTDPHYNVKIDGHVCGLGEVRHREFAFASGEMSQNEFTAFLTTTLLQMGAWCRDGAIAFVCMDWRHMRELLDAGAAAFSELKNLCVWNKTNGGMGTFYRSKHELVFVFKVGTAEHTNTFGLGDTGRYRTNVWDYAGISSLGSQRSEELAMHPTVKPVALVADAIRDCTKRGEIVLDAFGGSGTTLIAAETCGRKARLIEYDPAYCDTIIMRWERLTGQQARLLAEDGTGGEGAARSGHDHPTFEDIAEVRLEVRPLASQTRFHGVEPGLRKAVAARSQTRTGRSASRTARMSEEIQ